MEAGGKPNKKRRNTPYSELSQDKREKLRAKRRAWYARNPERAKALQAEYYRRNADERKRYARAYYRANRARAAEIGRVYKYGVTNQRLEEMLSEQGGWCAICGYSDRSDSEFFPVIDHDHDTGAVRGLLCFHCNVGIGILLDSPSILDRAATYLRKYAAREGFKARPIRRRDEQERREPTLFDDVA